MRQWQVDATALVHEIVATADRIKAAQAAGGMQVRTDAIGSLLGVLERSRWRGFPCIADLARDMGVSRQAAHRAVTKAARTGLVEVLPNPDDRRILQVDLTPRGRSVLQSTRARESMWVIALFNGLRDREIAAVSRILRVVRHRLVRDETDRRVHREREKHRG